MAAKSDNHYASYRRGLTNTFFN